MLHGRGYGGEMEIGKLNKVMEVKVVEGKADFSNFTVKVYE